MTSKKKTEIMTLQGLGRWSSSGKLNVKLGSKRTEIFIHPSHHQDSVAVEMQQLQQKVENQDKVVIGKCSPRIRNLLRCSSFNSELESCRPDQVWSVEALGKAKEEQFKLQAPSMLNVEFNTHVQVRGSEKREDGVCSKGR